MRWVFNYAFLAPGFLSAAVVPDMNVLLAPTMLDNAGEALTSLTVYQDTAGTDPTTIWFNVDWESSMLSLEFEDSNLDEGSDWYFGLEAGQAFTEGVVASGSLMTFVAASGAGFETNPLLITDQMEGFFLLVNTGQSGVGIQEDLPRDIYGWVQLAIEQVDGGVELVLLDNAVAYGEGGIVVGENIAIPEPKFPLLLGVVFLGGIVFRARS